MKLIIFDLDGTLLDTLQDLADSCNRILQKHGYPAHPIAAYRHFVGNGVRKLVERALPTTDRSEETIDSVLTDFKSYYEQEGHKYTRPYIGISEMLQKAKAAGFLLSVASNKYHEAVLPLISTYFPGIDFDLVLGHREGHPSKPDPDIVFDTLKTLNVAPQDCFYIGDSDVDMQTAKRAGVKAIGVTWGFRSEKELRESGATVIVHHPEEILLVCGGEN